METLDDVPEHVLRGLPEDVRLFPSAVDKTRLGECFICEERMKVFTLDHTNYSCCESLVPSCAGWRYLVRLSEIISVERVDSF